jgi:hypothetical protein
VLLPQHRDLAPQSAILLLERFARHGRSGSVVASLLSCPSPQLVGAHIQLPAHFGERCSMRSALGHQAHRFRFELGTERAPLTRPGGS